MADRRRRRRQASHSDSECSEGEDLGHNTSKPESEFATAYDNKETDDEEDYTYTEDETCTEYGEGDSVIIEEEYEEGWVDGERQSGDGEEQPDGMNKEKKLDDDEDRKNPAYVPRKGAFYEHDYRQGDEGKESKEEDPRSKKKLWADSQKWDHDKFNFEEQAPKSREELIAIYGYDIRSSDKLPDAPKRRPRAPMDRKSQLMDFIGGPRGPPRGRGAPRGRGGPRGRGRGRGGPQGFGSPRYNSSPPEEKYDQGPESPPFQGRPHESQDVRTYSNFKPNRTVGDKIVDAASYHPPAPPVEDNTPARQDTSNTQQIREQERGKTPPRFKQQVDHQPFQEAPQEHRVGAYEEAAQLHRGQGRPMRGRAKSITPDRIPPKKNIEGVLENAPPLTTIETRTKATVGTSEADGKKSYLRDRRVKGGISKIQETESQSVASDKQATVPENFQDSSKIGPPQVQGGFPPPPIRPEVRQPKRYSTQRQRTMPEVPFTSANPQTGQQMPRLGPASHSQGHLPRPQGQVPPNYRHQGPPPLRQQHPNTQTGPVRGQLPPNRSQAPTIMQTGPSPRMGPPLRHGVPQTQGQQQGSHPRGMQPSQPQMMTGPGRPPFFRPGVPPPMFTQQAQQRPVFQPAVASEAKSPPHSVHAGTFPLPPSHMLPGTSMQQPPTNQLQPFTMAANSQVQPSPPPLVYNPSGPPPPVSSSIAATVVTMSAGHQSLVPQGPYIGPPAALVNYGGPPPHYQMTGHVPVPFAPVSGDGQAVTMVTPAVASIPAPAQASGPQVYAQPPNIQVQPHGNPPPIHMRGGTTYFDPELQNPNVSRSPVRRPKAAIPIVNPQDITDIGEDSDEVLQAVYDEEYQVQQYGYEDQGHYLEPSEHYENQADENQDNYDETYLPQTEEYEEKNHELLESHENNEDDVYSSDKQNLHSEKNAEEIVGQVDSEQRNEMDVVEKENCDNSVDESKEKSNSSVEGTTTSSVMKDHDTSCISTLDETSEFIDAMDNVHLESSPLKEYSEEDYSLEQDEFVECQEEQPESSPETVTKENIRNEIEINNDSVEEGHDDSLTQLAQISESDKTKTVSDLSHGESRKMENVTPIESSKLELVSNEKNVVNLEASHSDLEISGETEV